MAVRSDGDDHGKGTPDGRHAGNLAVARRTGQRLCRMSRVMPDTYAVRVNLSILADDRRRVAEMPSVQGGMSSEFEMWKSAPEQDLATHLVALDIEYHNFANTTT